MGGSIGRMKERFWDDVVPIGFFHGPSFCPFTVFEATLMGLGWVDLAWDWPWINRI